jgi:O-antigen/teichoic acid export membrane protein
VSLIDEPTGARSAPGSSLLTDFLTTSAAQAISVILNASSLAVISRRLGEFDLGLYTLERRGMALLQPFVLLGLSVATPRYIAYSRGRGSGDETQYGAAAMVLVLGISSIVTLLIALAPGPVAQLAFGDRDAKPLAFALAGFTASTALFQMVYSVFRGSLRMARANVLEIVVVGLLPFLLALLGPADLVAFMWMLNAGIALAAIVAAFGTHAMTIDPRSAAIAVARHGRTLLRFGLLRTPGDVAVVALFSIGPLAVVHWSNASEAGYTSVVQSSLNLVSLAAVPLGVLLLPRVALDLGAQNPALRRKYSLLSDATVDVAVGLAGLMFLASPLIVSFWLPSRPPHAVIAEEVIALGIPGYVFYLIFRSYLDAVDTRPLSSIATLSGAACFATLLPVGLAYSNTSAPVVASIALSAALSITGLVTLLLLRERLLGVENLRSLLVPVGGVIPAVALGFAVREQRLLVVALATLAGSGAYAALLVVTRRPWVLELRARLKLWRVRPR